MTHVSDAGSSRRSVAIYYHINKTAVNSLSKAKCIQKSPQTILWKSLSLIWKMISKKPACVFKFEPHLYIAGICQCDLTHWNLIPKFTFGYHTWWVLFRIFINKISQYQSRQKSPHACPNHDVGIELMLATPLYYQQTFLILMPKGSTRRLG